MGNRTIYWAFALSLPFSILLLFRFGWSHTSIPFLLGGFGAIYCLYDSYKQEKEYKKIKSMIDWV